MNRTEKRLFAAFILFLCGVISTVAFFKSYEALFAILALFFAAGMSIAICESLDDTRIGEFLGNLFIEKGGDDE